MRVRQSWRRIYQAGHILRIKMMSRLIIEDGLPPWGKPRRCVDLDQNDQMERYSL
jgi:hypothetical protein